MNANPILLQKKYARIVQRFAAKADITLDAGLAFFYHSELYGLLRDGVSDMHCMSDEYLADELMMEYESKVGLGTPVEGATNVQTTGEKTTNP